MIHYKEYIKPTDLSEAYELNKSKSAVVAGGLCFLRLGNKTVKTLLDLTELLSHEIVEEDGQFRIGAMVSLRQLENHQALNHYTDGAVRDCVKRIVGTQFRNLATVGGSIFGRYGFSDILTCFLAMDTWVELYKGGQVSLREFVDMKKDGDILTAVIIKKIDMHITYEAFRNEAADFPVLSVAVAEYSKEKTVVSVGARPFRAEKVTFHGPASELSTGLGDEAASETASRFTYGSNMRATGKYREYLAGIMIGRAAKRVSAGYQEETGNSEVML